MNYTLEQKQNIHLAKAEGWNVEEVKDKQRGKVTFTLDANGTKMPLVHPYLAHLKLYRDSNSPDIKLHHIIAAHNYLWPDYINTWNHWEEERFYAHCAGYTQVVLAAGSGVGKSLSAAKIALLFYLSDPKRNACIIASTTLDSLESRIWGYAAALVNKASLPIAARVLRSKPPKVLMPGQEDKLHGMFAVAAKTKAGDPDTTISNLIGRHPDKGLLVVLDESPDLPASLVNAIPNWSQGVEFFQLWSIGNSCSKNDLHGALATPLRGWDSIDPARDERWETKHANSICIYNYPYKSPAITEKDPAKKAALSKFLITEERLKYSEDQEGLDSDSFWRFTLGFWKKHAIDKVILSKKFLEENQVYRTAEWAGFYPLHVVAALDPAFQSGGTGCVLQGAVLGQRSDGVIGLDFRKDELLVRIDIQNRFDASGEKQLATQVVDWLLQYNVPLDALAIDATGVGRALGELIKLFYENRTGKQEPEPWRVVSVRPSKKKGDTDPFIKVVASSDLWLTFREYVQSGQIRGLSDKTSAQMSHRLVNNKGTDRIKLVLETKDEYKARMNSIDSKLAHSPDEADAAVLALHAAIYKYGFTPGETRAVPTDKVQMAWDEKMRIYKMQMDDEKKELSYIRPTIISNFTDGVEDKFK